MRAFAYAVLTLSLSIGCASAQHATPKMSDDEIIKTSLSAAPDAIAKGATVIALNDGKVRVVRKGTNGWTCLPGSGDQDNPDPMCGDVNAMEWAKAWMEKKEPPANKVGLMYMLQGDNGASNTDPYASHQAADNNWIKTGPHVMIVGAGVKSLEGYPRAAQADAAKPYIMWPGTPYEHVMMPVGR